MKAGRKKSPKYSKGVPMLEHFLLPDLQIDKEHSPQKVKANCDTWGLLWHRTF